jgi:alkaline phosphatase D
MLDTRPDFFIHCGDTIYADIEIPESVVEDSGEVWRNVVWITADVHYTAAHLYSPDRAAYTDFDPFWEFVSGPIASETFPREDDVLDQTFGPTVVFSKGNDTDRRQSPRDGNQFFGHVAIAADGVLTVTLYDGSGTALWSRALEPEPLRPVTS